ncbi:hypothetical protein BCR34DRAFT_587102 [Clohesyomyces aquaticus]|uniref:Uncharacterized protein n=1 Tax=Clohesyomyces aquaticus TaxID=1231657 RepID=A0A1Y1ZQY5_9PLEO|nr:hypothetical protein BCR34DRAFT_587102 [Clohesyomyces aquaticus]
MAGQSPQRYYRSSISGLKVMRMADFPHLPGHGGFVVVLFLFASVDTLVNDLMLEHTNLQFVAPLAITEPLENIALRKGGVGSSQFTLPSVASALQAGPLVLQVVLQIHVSPSFNRPFTPQTEAIAGDVFKDDGLRGKTSVLLLQADINMDPVPAVLIPQPHLSSVASRLPPPRFSRLFLVIGAPTCPPTSSFNKIV